MPMTAGSRLQARQADQYLLCSIKCSTKAIPKPAPSSAKTAGETATTRTYLKTYLYEYAHNLLIPTECAISLHFQTRWVDYKDYEKDASQIDPGWHAWISYLVDAPPTEDKLLEVGRRPWDDKTARVNYTLSRAAYRPYSTYVNHGGEMVRSC